MKLFMSEKGDILMGEPIRVLHVVTYMGRGGLETMLMNYYRHIDRNRVQFDFLVHRDFKADYDDEILSLGGRIYHVSKLNPFSFHYHHELNNFFKNHPEYKIVHVHQDCLSSFALKAAKRNHVSIRIAHSHNANQDRNLKYLVKRYFMKSIPKYATHLFACGKEAGDWMFQGSPFTIMNNAIDTDQFIYNQSIRENVRNTLNIDSNILVIGHVGRFFYQKNHDFLIDIFNEVHRINKNTKLMLIGTGELEESIKEKVNNLHLKDNVMFLGNKNDVNQLMQAMDIFVFPSHYEGLPVTLVEAQASDLFIVKSNNVPSQCIMTPHILSLSLDSTAKEWAQQILNIHYQRGNTSRYIKDAGYDIKQNSQWLQDFYIQEVSHCE